MRPTTLLAALSLAGIAAASCGAASTGDNSAKAAEVRHGQPFAIESLGQFDDPWAMAIDPGTGVIFVTEKAGRIKFVQPNGKLGFVSGVPKVDYGGQGGLGDFVFAPAPVRPALDQRTVYLSWVEAGQNDTRGAVVGRAQMVCADHDSCDLRDLRVIWRQQPKVTGLGHYSHRLAFSPDGRQLFVASGERMRMTPAQDLSGNLGKIVRLNLDGTPAAGNPLATRGGVTQQIWTSGHRNILGLKFDAAGRLWGLEHGPAGGDELNLIEPGKNYGWPLVSEGRHYGGRAIPPHASRPDIAAPAISWNPVIAPGDFIFYRGGRFAGWRGQAIIAAMKPAAVVRVAIAGNRAREVARYPMRHRIRSIAQRADGSILLLEDGKDSGAGRLLRLTPTRR